MTSTTIYAGQTSRRIRFSEDDPRSLVQMLAAARLSDEETDESDVDSFLGIDPLLKRKENLNVQKSDTPASTISIPSLKSTNGTRGEVRRLGLLGGSVRRVEKKDNEEVDSARTPRGKFKRDSLKGLDLSMLSDKDASRLSTGSLSTSTSSSSLVKPTQGGRSSNTSLLVPSHSSGGTFTRRLIKTPIPIVSSPASATDLLNRLNETSLSSLKTTANSPIPVVSSATKCGQVGWSPQSSSPFASPLPFDKKLPKTSSPLEGMSPVSAPKFLEEDYHEKEYEYHQVLGKGSFGKVLLASHRKTKEIVAIKVLDRKKLLERANLRRAHSEIRCLEKAGSNDHYVVGLKRAFETKQKIFIVQDFCVGGELFSLLQVHGHLSPDAVRFYTAQCAVAIAHLHSKRFAYRDLKTENIMLDHRGYVRLVDFGLVKEGIVSPDRGSRSFVGTTEYMAPEMLTRKGHGFAVDWWALGVVIHELLTGLPPWYTTEYQEMQRRVVQDPLVLDTSGLEPSTLPTIAHLLEKNPLKRLGSSSDELRAVKNSLFFKGMDWDKLLMQQAKAPFVPDLDHECDLKYFAQEFLDLPVEL